MLSSFFLAGPGIRRGSSLGIIDMRDIAPTLGELMGFELGSSQGHSVVRRIAVVEAR
jgi:hypothetical protein